MSDSGIRRRVAAYYAGRLREHGATPQGVDWNSSESQALRFRQLLRLCEGESGEISVNDYGCGYGALVDHLQQRDARFTYCGFDIAEPMVARARELHGDRPHCTFVSDETQLRPADYTFASGIFNVKQETSEEIWAAYVLETLARLAALSRRGFAFNVLTLHSDPAKRRPDLYYADPVALFEHCRRTFSPRVALLHDYPLFEFTILVRVAGIP